VLSRFARVELLGRLRGQAFLRQPEAYREELFAAIRGVVTDHVPPTVDARLRPTYRVELALVRAGRRDLVEQLAAHDAGLKARARVKHLKVSKEQRVNLKFEAWLETGGVPVVVERDREHALLSVPPAVAAFVPRDIRHVPDDRRGTARVLVRRREDSAELVAPGTVTERVTDVADGSRRIRYDVETEIDPAMLSVGGAIGPAKWDVFGRVEMFGYGQETRLGFSPLVIDSRRRLRVGERDLVGRARGVARAIYHRLPPRLQRAARSAYGRLPVAGRSTAQRAR
jgi:poly(ribitol-phosphate) beta-N-acetylglucosaminyltransferase